MLHFSEIRFEDREKFVCFFRGDFNGTPPQRRSHTHTQTLTHTHMTVKQWMRGQVVPDFRVLQFSFRPSEVRIFLDRQGVTQYTKIFLLGKLFLFIYVCIFLTQALCCTCSRLLGFNLSCKVSLLEINCTPTAGKSENQDKV